MTFRLKEVLVSLKEKSDILEKKTSPENFEPLDVIEQSRETVEKLKSQDKAEHDQVDENSEEYNRGYQDALKNLKTGC